MYTAGSVSLTTILAGRDQLLDAELQLAKTKEQRLTLYQERLDNMRALEDAVKKRYEAGQSTLESKLSATAARLQAEIDLLREQL
jgi:outer membrane protein TolC